LPELLPDSFKQLQGAGTLRPKKGTKHVLAETAVTVEVASAQHMIEQVVGAPGCPFQ